MNRRHKGRGSITGKQIDAILGVLQPAGEEWMSTRAIADLTPWAVLTVIARLRQAEDRGLVESREGPGRSIEWRLK